MRVFAHVYVLLGIGIAFTGCAPLPKPEGTHIPVEVQRFSGHLGPPHDLIFSPDGLRMAANCICEVSAWDLVKREPVFRCPTEIEFRPGHIAFTPDGNSLLVAEERSGYYKSGEVTTNQPIRLWDIGRLQLVTRFKGNMTPALSVAVSPDGRQVLTTHLGPKSRQVGRYTIRLWDSASGAELKSMDAVGGNEPWAVFTADGKRALVVNQDGNLWVWDLQTGKDIGCFELGGEKAIQRFAFSADGGRVIAQAPGREGSPKVDPNHKVQVWDTQTGKEIRHWSYEGSRPKVYGVAPPPPQQFVSGVALSGDGKRAVIGLVRREYSLAKRTGPQPATPAGTEARLPHAIVEKWVHTIRLLSVDSGERVAEFTVDTFYLHGVALSHDGSQMLFGHDDKSIRLWQLTP